MLLRALFSSFCGHSGGSAALRGIALYSNAMQLNSRPHADARASAVACNGLPARAGGRGRLGFLGGICAISNNGQSRGTSRRR